MELQPFFGNNRFCPPNSTNRNNRVISTSRIFAASVGKTRSSGFQLDQEIKYRP